MMRPDFLRQEVIGEGGMGQIVRALDPQLERVIALKELREEYVDDRDLVRRFTQEARITGQLQHPNIPPVFELGNHPNGTPFVALQLIEGQTLAEIIDRLRAGELHAEYPWMRRVQVIMRVAEALLYAHSRGWIHRDVKPENIMIGQFGEVYLMDWGVAKKFEKEKVQGMRTGPPKTAPGIFTGTPRYASPEQLAGEELGPASDQFALGTVLYEFLTLHLPHLVQEPREWMTAVLNQKPPAPEVTRHNTQGRVPRELSLIVMRALEKDPARRYPSLAEMRADLLKYAENTARPVCPHTTAKSVLFKLSRFLDNHPMLGNLIFYPWVLFPLVMLVYWLVRWLQS